MHEFKKFVAHVTNLKQRNVKQATFDVEYLERVLSQVPNLAPVSLNSEPLHIIGDGGKFEDDE